MAISKSKTATLSVSTTGATFYLKAELVENSTNLTNNTSNMTIKATLSAKSGGSSFVGTGGTLYIDWLDNNDGNWHNKASKNITSLSSGSSSSTSSTFNITHKTDGTLKGRVRARWDNAGTSYAPSDSSVTTDAVSLTNIPRNSKIDVSKYNTIIADHIFLLDVTRYSANYTDTISWNMSANGSTLSETIQTKGTNSKIALCFDDYAYNNISVPSGYVKMRSTYSNEDLMNLIGNSYSNSISFTIQTFNGNTQIGNNYTANSTYQIIRSPYDLTATAVVNDSLSTTLTGNTNTIIKGISNVLVTITAVKNQYYNDNSTLSQYLFYTEYNPIVENLNYHIFEKVTAKDFNTNILDSRGLNSAVATASVTNILDYFKPVISSLRTSRAEATSTNINFDIEGSFWNNNFGNSANSITLKYRFKLGQGTYSQYTTITPTITGNSFTYSGTFNSGSSTSDATIEVLVIDSTNSEFALDATEPKGESIFDIGDSYFGVNGTFAINHTIVMDIIQAVENKVNSLFFVANEQYTYNRVVAGGCITGSKQSLVFAIPLPKFAIGLNVSITGGVISARGIGGYLLNGTNITSASQIIVSNGQSFLSIGLTYPAFSSATNNTPVNIVLDGLKLKFTSA